MPLSIHLDDEDMLRVMLGCRSGELPQNIQDEYLLRRALFDLSRGSGPMGRAMLIDLVRSVGLQAPQAPKTKERVNWHIQPQDGSLRVEAMFQGSLHRGSFLGFVAGGTLKIRLDHDPVIREFVRADVQVSEDQSPLVPPKREDDEPEDPTDMELPPDDEPWEESDSDPEPVAVAPKKKGGRPKKKPEPPPEPEPIDWKAIGEGASVWVGEDSKDGEFVAMKDAETLLVQLDGENSPREFPIHSVNLAS